MYLSTTHWGVSSPNVFRTTKPTSSRSICSFVSLDAASRNAGLNSSAECLVNLFLKLSSPTAANVVELFQLFEELNPGELVFDASLRMLKALKKSSLGLS
jgi:hypothetical protein